MFVRPEGDAEGHVLHLSEGERRAIDYAVLSGMPAWKGERDCFYFAGDAIVTRQIRPLRNRTTIFEVY